MNDNKTEMNDNTFIIELKSYIQPAIVETPGRKWVGYGVKNDYYDYLLERYNGSVTNSALINGISDMIYGLGLDAKNASSKPTEYAQMKILLKKSDMRGITMDLKLLGNCALQIIYNKEHTKIVEVAHMPVQQLRAEKANEDGDIENYYYSANWSRPTGKNKPESIPVFDVNSNDAIQILFIQPYKPGSFYYSPPDWQSGAVYAELEEEVANYHITNIQNGFSPSTLLNFNNGTTKTVDQKRQLEAKVNSKFSGSGGKKILLSFNDNVDNATTVETIPISDAAEQYQFLSDEAQSKILLAHKVTSPLLFGIQQGGSGFSSNADELTTASVYFEHKTVRIFQEIITDALDEVLAFNKISLDLYFKSSAPDFSVTEATEVEPINTTKPE